MNPGLELDKKVAELLGWTELEVKQQGGTSLKRLQGVKPGTVASPHTGHRPKVLVPEYSTDIKAAWDVVDEFTLVEIETSGDGGWMATLGSSTNTEYGYTAPHAICLAFLKIKEKPQDFS